MKRKRHTQTRDEELVPAVAGTKAGAQPRGAKRAGSARAADRVQPTTREDAATPAKAVRPAKPAKAAKATKPARPTRSADTAVAKAARVMKDRFRMPRADFDALRALKQRVRALGHEAKKSELIRAGLRLLARADDASLLAALPTRD